MRVIWNTLNFNITYHNVVPATLAGVIGSNYINSMITSDGQLITDTVAMGTWINAQVSGDDTIWASIAADWRYGAPSLS